MLHARATRRWFPAALIASSLLGLGCGGGGRESQPPRPPGLELLGTENGGARSIAPTSDGGYILAGYEDPGALGGTDILLVKVDSTGNVAWSASHGGAGNDYGLSVRQTDDGGYIVAGVTDDTTLGGGPGGILLLKTDATGQRSWLTTFGGTGSQPPTASVRQTLDGGYVLAGTGPGTSVPAAYLVKTDATGSLQWQTTFGGTAGAWIQGYDVQQTLDGGYILAGERVGDQAYAVKTSSSGDMEWEQTFGSLGGPLFSVQQTPDGGYAYFGRHTTGPSTSATLMVKGDANGHLDWERTAGALTEGGAAVAGQRTSDGGYVVATTGASRNLDAYVVRTDAAGNELWARLYGGDGSDTARAILQRPDGGFVVAGGSGSFGSSSAFWFLRLAADGSPE